MIILIFSTLFQLSKRNGNDREILKLTIKTTRSNTMFRFSCYFVALSSYFAGLDKVDKSCAVDQVLLTFFSIFTKFSTENS